MMNGKKIYLTKKGFEDLQKEYDDMVKKRRPEVVERLSSAREMGDLSENAEYTAAREELAFIDGRIEELDALLKQAELISDDIHKTQAVDLGSQVVVKIGEKKETFTVVGEWEADPTEKKISHESPLGKALIGKAVGDEIEVEAPAGKMLYKIVSIS
ncbi:MAG TPA: transcription elongation factor GreA [Candidatus Sulfotelmatobacter sp.]|jgi:transcription elongation factor GreA|nr:transcription elongation factor GreA [Candidatus Sulfotelmatobacter sp.]